MNGTQTERQALLSEPVRSWLFVPGSQQRFIDKVTSVAADAVVLDLEDGVLPDEKDAARERVARTVQEDRGWDAFAFVRVNAPQSRWFDRDIEAVALPGVDGLVIPKIQRPADIVQVASLLDRLEEARGGTGTPTALVAAIEDASGVLHAAEIAEASPRVVGLMFGAEDFSLSIGLRAHRTGEAQRLTHARSAIVIAAAAAGVLSIDGVYPDLDDTTGLRTDTAFSVELGFDAKTCFHPKQLDMINEMFRPSEDDVAFAREVVEAAADAAQRGHAAAVVRGQFIDLPIVRRAERILGGAR